MHTKSWYKRRARRADGLVHLIGVAIDELSDSNAETFSRDGLIGILQILQNYGRRDV